MAALDQICRPHLKHPGCKSSELASASSLDISGAVVGGTIKLVLRNVPHIVCPEKEANHSLYGELLVADVRETVQLFASLLPPVPPAILFCTAH